MNCLLLEQGDGILVIDCGSSFPNDDRGIDLYHPDFAYLLERRELVRGIFLTHGHEDHIGGIPYLVKQLPVPIHGPPHALGLVRRRLIEHDIDPDDLSLNVAEAGERHAVGGFVVEPIRVAHSIVEASALCIETSLGTMVHTGDFTFDPDPPDGEPTDQRRLEQIGDGGVALLLSDSTNIDSVDRIGGERSVGAALERIVAESPARVVVALFASNIQRLMLLGDIAVSTHRRICLLGRSLEAQVEVATKIGRLHWPSDLLVAPDKVHSLPPRNVLVLAGGTQGEKNSAMVRLARGAHPKLELVPSDTVVFSSRAIPGNERLVQETQDAILRKGAMLRTMLSEPEVHTSGHASRSEQAWMLELLRPERFIPVHGTLRHMMRHAELARSFGVPHVQVTENGIPVSVTANGLALEQPVRWGKLAVSTSGEPLDAETLKRRGDIGRTGVAFVALALDARDRIVAGPSVSTVGVAGVDDDAKARSVVQRDVLQAVRRLRSTKVADLEEELRRVARRALLDLCGVRPVVKVEVLRSSEKS
jgi:ribonuclease J